MKKCLFACLLACVSTALAYKPFEVKVSFFNGGGSGSMATLRFVKDCDRMDYMGSFWKYTMPKCAFTRSGYVFAGWDVYDGCVVPDDRSGFDGGYNGRYQEGATYPLCGWLELVATWRRSGGGDGGYGHFRTARTLTAALYDGWRPVGVVQLKVGKISKLGQVKVSGFIMGTDGKKRKISSASADGRDGAFSVSLPVAGSGSRAVLDVDETRISGSWNGLDISPSTVGGELYSSWMDFDFGDVPDEFYSAGAWYAVFTGYDPWSENIYGPEPVVAAGRRLKTGKAASVKWVKCKCIRIDGELVCPACSGSWQIDTSRGRTNMTGLKLSYMPKTGLFKGSFKVYAENESTLKGKTFTAKVTGVVVDGSGHGQAQIKSTGVSWDVDLY